MVRLLKFTLTKTSNSTFPCLDKTIFIGGRILPHEFFHIILNLRNASASKNYSPCPSRQLLCTCFDYFTLQGIPLDYLVAFHRKEMSGVGSYSRRSRLDQNHGITRCSRNNCCYGHVSGWLNKWMNTKKGRKEERKEGIDNCERNVMICLSTHSSTSQQVKVLLNHSKWTEYAY